MNQEELKKLRLVKIRTIEKKLKLANDAYARGFPFLTDTDYDILWQQLHDLSPDASVLYHTANNPNLPYDIFPHAHRIYGTNKAFNTEDLKPFLHRFGHTDLLLQPKYDGLAAVFYKGKDENSDRLLLEGDGLNGRDISHHLQHLFFGFTPRSVESVEILIPNNLWIPIYGKNPRNTVSGWIAKATLPHHNTAEVVSHNNSALSAKYQFNGDYEKLEELLLSLYAEWSKQYPLDGIMLKVSDEELRLISDNNGTAYNWSIAWKPPISTAETIVTDIEWNVSRTGRVIPTVLYEPINLCGTTNSRVTGNNAAWILEHKVHSEAKIIIGKAGEIIPKIIHVTPSPFSCNLPFDCPICDSVLEWKGVDLICEATDCISQLTKSIAYFYSDKGMDVKTIGEYRIADILQDDQIRKILQARVYALLDPITFNIYDSIHLIWGAKHTFNYMKSLEEVSGRKNAVHFIAALGYKGLAYKTALKLFHYVKTGKKSSSISSVAKENFVSAFSTFLLADEQLSNFIFASVPQLAKITYCVTGTLSCSRTDMIAYLEKHSWSFSNQVSKHTDILLVGSSPGRTKTIKAKELSVPTITEEDLPTYLTATKGED